MNAQLSADWLQQVLLRIDPLAVWPGVGSPGSTDYRQEAQLAARDLREVRGAGHGYTVVADAIDRVHPGFYRAAAEAQAGDGLWERLAQISREIWATQGARSGTELRRPEAPATPLPESPPIDVLIHDDAALRDWLRAVEEHLAIEVWNAWSGPAASALLAVLPTLVDAYVAGSDQARAAMRLTFSRFSRVFYRLSSFAGMQARLLDGPHSLDGLRRCLAAVSLLDRRIDYRDDLMLLQQVRRAATSNGLPFETELTRVADCSSAETAKLLRRVLGGG